MRKLFLTTSLLVAIGGATEAAKAKDFSNMTIDQIKAYQTLTIKHDKDVIHFWTNHPRLYSAHWKFASKDARFHRMQLQWTRRERRELMQAKANIVLDSAFLCIHKYEGAWNANTGNGYYGGLQMDYGFMQTYGGDLLSLKGTADNWTPAEQIQVARRARDSGRGYSPWPNTARKCGLI